MTRLKNSLLLLFVFLSFTAFSQENVAKIGMTDALLGNFNFNFERVVNERQSVQLKVGFWKPTFSPFINDDNVTPEAFELQELNGGMNASIEYRFYASKSESPNGLYIAPYIRYINQSGIYTDRIEGDIFNVDAQLNSIGIGAQLGYQLIINEIFTLDFYFFGAGVDHHGLKFQYELQNPQSGFDYNSITDDVNAVFEDINYLESKLEHKVNNDNLSSKLPFLFPGFRMGINVGVAF